MKKTINSLKNHFLVAMPNLHDENFSGSVVYNCEHNVEGAMGLIINQQLDIPAKAVFDRLDLEQKSNRGDELIRRKLTLYLSRVGVRAKFSSACEFVSSLRRDRHIR